ncbi:MAG: hypothetical protein JW869_06740 [Candidatus Omnitrophica bacterium]|nr:hypothetical protein [Candidatus Omnitrophota bacterium]
MERPNKQIGEILIEKGLITQAQLDDALMEQKMTKEFLGKILLKRALVSEKDFIKALSEQYGIPYVDINQIDVNIAVAMKFSPTYILDHQCVPIKEDDYSVTVAISNPLNVQIFSEMEKEANMRSIKLVLICAKDMNWLVQFYQQYKKLHMRKLFED